ncbi:MAG: M4 family metallopeptidase [Chloroflexi bacterium]|nr:M4 family metallopeptidase [Chloroflexota bacterium]
MYRSNPSWVKIILLNFILLATSVVTIGQAPGPNSSAVLNAQTGHARLLTFDAGVLGMPARDRVITALSVATDAVYRYGGQFGASGASNYQVTGNPVTLDSVAGGATAVRYVQILGGVPVYGTQVAVNVRGDGALMMMAGDISSLEASSLNLSPALAADAAGLAARDYVALRYGIDPQSLIVEDGGLWIYDPAVISPGLSAKRAGLVWKVDVSAAGLPIRVVALVDAHSAEVSFAFNTIHASTVHGDWQTARQAGLNFGAGLVGPAPANSVANAVRVPGTADLSTHNANHGTVLPGTFVCDEGTLACTSGADTDADKAHTFANGTYNLYYTLHGRDSLDNAGMQLISTVHFSSAYCNAFWNGTQMAYGDGCSIVHDDVVGHELTHGVTEFTSNLIYAYDSGAINESFSDVWGEFYDLGNGTAEDIPANRWVIGEEISAGGFRDMENPPSKGDPDRVGSPIFWTDARDTGGVHINSGINNKAAYLMADGGTFNGQTITGLGMVKPLHIYYYVQTMLAGPGSTYNDLGVFLAAACDALVGGAAGITAGDCIEVDEVILATEMALPSPHLPDSAEVCSGGQIPQNVFFDNFENSATSAGKWTTSVFEGAGNPWILSSTAVPLSGTASMRVDNTGSSSDSAARFTTGVVVPANAYLHFDHQYLWEYDGWDGAVIQYSTDGGANWTTFQNAEMTGEIYPGLMEFDTDAAFPGDPAFTGDSFGPGSTRVDLSALSGQTALIRFFATSDSAFSAGNPDGWWIDNVRVYTCVTPVTSLLDNGGLESGLASWTLSNATGDKVSCDGAQAFSGTCSLRFKGGVGENSILKQNVDLTGETLTENDVLSLSAYFRGGNPAAKARMYLIVTYVGNPVPAKTKVVVGPNASYTVVSAPDIVLTAETIATIRVKVKHSSTAGKMYMDDAALELTAVRSEGAALPPPALPSGMRGSN